MAFDERQDRVLLHHAHLDQHFAQPQALLRALGQRLVQLLRRDDVGADELLAERGPQRRATRRRGSPCAPAALASQRSSVDLVRQPPHSLHKAPHRAARIAKDFKPRADARRLQHFATQRAEVRQLQRPAHALTFFLHVQQQFQPRTIDQRHALQIEHDLRLPALEPRLEHAGQLGDVLAGNAIAAADHVDRALAFCVRT